MEDPGPVPAFRGWRNHLHARRPSPTAVNGRLFTVRRFQRFVGDSPWTWYAGGVERYVCQIYETGRTPSIVRADIAGDHELRACQPSPAPVDAAGDRDRPDQFEYADYLLALGYTQQELASLVAARPEE